MQRNTTVSLLLAGLMAATGAVHAQSTAAGGTSSIPPKAGEASTQVNGVPNRQISGAADAGGNVSSGTGMGVTTGTGATAGVAATTPATPATKDQIRMGAHGQSNASATSSVPPRAGEASTTVRGNPNADPNNPMLTKSKAERRSEKAMKKAERDQARQAAIMGQKGAQAGAPAGTPAVSPAGTPSVQEGGTPK